MKYSHTRISPHACFNPNPIFFQKLCSIAIRPPTLTTTTTITANIEHVVLAMPHRGRTPLQTVLLNMRPAKVFRKLSGASEFADDIEAMSDVISHFRK